MMAEASGAVGEVSRTIVRKPVNRQELIQMVQRFGEKRGDA